jgi:predicted CopG family antitoxin
MKTTIQIDGTTLEKLKKVKITKRESYDEIINRLLIEYRNYKSMKVAL